MAFSNISPKIKWGLSSLIFIAFLGLSGCGKGKKVDYLVEDGPVISTSSSSNSSSSSSSNSSSSSSSGAGNGQVTDSTGAVVNVVTQIVDNMLPVAGSTAMHLIFTGQNNLPVEVPGTWTAASGCTSVGRATISAAVVSSNRVSFNYVANGCTGVDEVMFTKAGTPIETLTANITVEEDAVSYISWVKTEPPQLNIRGSGGTEKAIITFRVNGLSSNAVADQLVNFRFEGVSGGVTLAANTAISDDSGLVRATVQAGSTPVVVTVVAEDSNTGIEAVSGGLVVATGLAADRHFNSGLSIFNPLAWSRINAQPTQLTVAVTDRSGNPVVDGTVVNFVSEEGGAITPSCTTTANTCSVTWKPDGRQPADGRSQIFATVKGTEDFVDNNGNKIFDNGDTFNASYDLGEPYSDNNDNDAYDLGEHFVDTDGDKSRDAGDGLWNGLNCQHPTLCSTTTNFIDLGTQLTVYMSNDSPTICNTGGFGNNSSFNVVAGGALSISGLYLSDGNSAAINPEVGAKCATGNPLPNGTVVAFSVSGGTLQGSTSWTIGNAIRPTGGYGISYKAPSTAGTEVLTLTVSLGGQVIGGAAWNLNVTAPVVAP